MKMHVCCIYTFSSRADNFDLATQYGDRLKQEWGAIEEIMDEYVANLIVPTN